MTGELPLRAEKSLVQAHCDVWSEWLVLVFIAESDKETTALSSSIPLYILSLVLRER